MIGINKIKMDKHTQLWMKIVNLGNNNVPGSWDDCVFWNFISNCGFTDVGGGLKNSVEIKHYIEARKLVNNPLTNHELIELIKWWEDE